MVQLFITLGLVLGFFICYATVRIPSSLSWRLPLALQAGIAFVLVVASYFYLPQSPRWLAYKGRRVEASVAWDRLGVSDAEREKDLLQNPDSAIAATSRHSPSRPREVGKSSLRQRVRGDVNVLTAVFRKGARKPMLLGVFLMTMQQLSGIDGVIYVGPARLFPLDLAMLSIPSLANNL